MKRCTFSQIIALAIQTSFFRKSVLLNSKKEKQEIFKKEPPAKEEELNIKNDISFVFDFELNLYEQQSSVNPNMPLRDLFYVSKVLQNIVKNDNLYGSRQIKIPTPRFVVFYNGSREQAERKKACRFFSGFWSRDFPRRRQSSLRIFQMSW